jgi:hypothetical protein
VLLQYPPLTPCFGIEYEELDVGGAAFNPTGHFIEERTLMRSTEITDKGTVLDPS